MDKGTLKLFKDFVKKTDINDVTEREQKSLRKCDVFRWKVRADVISICVLHNCRILCDIIRRI